MEMVHGPISLTGTGTNGTTKTEAENSLSNKKDEKREHQWEQNHVLARKKTSQTLRIDVAVDLNLSVEIFFITEK